MTWFLVPSPANDLLQSQLLISASASSDFLTHAAEMLLKQTGLKLFDMFFISMFPEPSVVPDVWSASSEGLLTVWMNESVTIQVRGRLLGPCSSAPWGIPLSGLKKVPYSIPDVISQDNRGNSGTDIFCLREAHCVKTYSYGNNKLWWWWFF